MTFSHNFLTGPWRAVPVLGVTQILAWGGIYYTPVLIVPMIAREHGWSMSFAMGGFSFALLAAGLSAPYIGRAIDRFGGHVVMTAGSLTGALGLVLITIAEHRVAYVAVWILLGVALSASLYDAAFSSLGRIFGAAARRPITALTLAGGFASTVGWPATHYLTELVGWRGTYVIYAALLVVIAAPLHAFLLPRHRFAVEAPPSDGIKAPDKVLPARGWPFMLVAGGFAVYAFVPSGLAAHLLAIFARSGIDSDTVVWIGALFGPAQVGARVIEFAFGRNLHPLWIARIALTTLFAGFVMIAVFGFSAPAAAAFAIIFGGSNGLITIARGAVPLALFGASGYGRLMGRLAFPFLLVQSAAPLVMAVVIDGASDKAALTLACAFGTAALVCFYVIRRPDRTA
ncbi:MFS transporter [Pseudolabrys sp. FHR47]|uniref:MFS transporter n=1 Tax=Pseudolabrys sp. FHR47 TaxID=2562284 RepID=UPI0010BEBC69|nr:MFS transporter [Pseudolabrys sp. FHR47]